MLFFDFQNIYSSSSKAAYISIIAALLVVLIMVPSVADLWHFLLKGQERKLFSVGEAGFL